MRKIIELENEDKIRIISDKDGDIIEKGYIENGEVIKTISFIRKSDYCFVGFTNVDSNKVDFEFNDSDPLYNHLDNLLKDEEQLLIDDDLTREVNQKIMLIHKNQDKIVVTIENKLGESLLDKLNISVINVAYDLRSKADQNDTDIKARLHEFFENVMTNILEESFQKSR